MKLLLRLLQKAKRSNFYLAFLNIALLRAVPFNKPHGLKITSVHDDGVTIFLPYKRKNLNHLKGIHACALATLAEYASGISLLICIGTDYRLIMKTINVTYHYQAKMNVAIALQLEKKMVEEKILTPLQTNDSVVFENKVEVYDVRRNHICTTVVQWQIKKWAKVKTL